MTKRLLTADEIAERLNVPVGWIREHTRAGNLPCRRLGRYTRYLEADIDAWLESCKQPGRPITFRTTSPRRQP